MTQNDMPGNVLLRIDSSVVPLASNYAINCERSKKKKKKKKKKKQQNKKQA